MSRRPRVKLKKYPGNEFVVLDLEGSMSTKVVLDPIKTDEDLSPIRVLQTHCTAINGQRHLISLLGSNTLKPALE